MRKEPLYPHIPKSRQVKVTTGYLPGIKITAKEPWMMTREEYRAEYIRSDYKTS